MPTETAVAAAGLLSRDTLDRRPGLKVCLAHGGGALPAILPRLDRGARLADPDVAPDALPSARARRLYCDSLTYDAASLRLAIDRFGPGHVLLGTDYPFAARETPPGAVLDDLTLPDELRSAIGQHNAKNLITTSTGGIRWATSSASG